MKLYSEIPPKNLTRKTSHRSFQSKSLNDFVNFLELKLISSELRDFRDVVVSLLVKGVESVKLPSLFVDIFSSLGIYHHITPKMKTN